MHLYDITCSRAKQLVNIKTEASSNKPRTRTGISLNFLLLRVHMRWLGRNEARRILQNLSPRSDSRLSSTDLVAHLDLQHQKATHLQHHRFPGALARLDTEHVRLEA